MTAATQTMTPAAKECRQRFEASVGEELLKLRAEGERLAREEAEREAAEYWQLMPAEYMALVRKRDPWLNSISDHCMLETHTRTVTEAYRQGKPVPSQVIEEVCPWVVYEARSWQMAKVHLDRAKTRGQKLSESVCADLDSGHE